MRFHYFSLLLTSIGVHAGLAKPACNSTFYAVLNAFDEISTKVWEYTDLMTNIWNTAQISSRIAESDIYLAMQLGIDTSQTYKLLNLTLSDYQIQVLQSTLSDMETAFVHEIVDVVAVSDDILAVNAQHDLYTTYTLQSELLSAIWSLWSDTADRSNTTAGYFEDIYSMLNEGIVGFGAYLPGANCTQTARKRASSARKFN